MTPSEREIEAIYRRSHPTPMTDRILAFMDRAVPAVTGVLCLVFAASLIRSPGSVPFAVLFAAFGVGLLWVAAEAGE